MLIVLPTIAIIIGYYIFFQTNKCWRSAVLSTSVMWGVIVTVITELLSFFHISKSVGKNTTMLRKIN
jgi:hypothetical protein